MTHRMGWWGIQWVSGSQGDSFSPFIFFFGYGLLVSSFPTSISVSRRLSCTFENFTRSSPPSSNPSHDIQILSGRNSSSRALRDFVGTVKDRRSHSIPENPRSTCPAVVEQEALYSPASRGLETPRSTAISRERVRGGVYGSPGRLDLGPFFRRGVAWGRRG